jgi:hypothetical protein
LKQPLVTLIVRAKKNCVAYFEAQQPQKKKRGRPRKYGKKVTLNDYFDKLNLFEKSTCRIYGKIEEVSIMAINLLWKPTGRMVRFVLAVTSRGPIVLMCSDLHQLPVVSLELYCARTRIEIMFDMLKNLIGAFHYRFWSKQLPRHSRKPKKNKDLKQPCSQDLDNTRACWEAYERFVMLGGISLGLLQLIALKYTNSIWDHYDGFLRTQSRQLPSERTVKHVVARLIVKDFFISAPRALMREIQGQYFRHKLHRPSTSRSAETEDLVSAA